MNNDRCLPVLVAALASCAGEGDAAGDASLIHTVRRSDLVITVRERGELHAAQDTRVSSELEGRNTLIYLIPEGTVVEEGDKLAELDASAIEEKRTSEAIVVAKADAALEQARKNLEILEKELRAAEKTAESRLKIAHMRAEKLIGQPREALNGSGATSAGTNAEMVGKLRELLESEVEIDPEAELKYTELVDGVSNLLGPERSLELQMGEIANQILAQINEISLARANLELAADTLRFSKQLAEKGYVTDNQLARDLIDHQRQLSQLTLAWNNLELLIHYTLRETLITTEQEVENAQLGLESVRAANEARRVREAAELRSSEAEFEVAQERLDNWTRQIEKAIIRAPTPGLVVYGRWDWDEPVYEGMEVRQRQEVIILPDVATMVAELSVHEAQIDKVALGQPATMEVDAFPDRSFAGRVSEVSTLPDPGPSWRRSVKVYRVEVVIDVDNSDGTLRPGMSASVEIDVGTLEDVLNVPLPAIERRQDTHFVWKVTPRGPVATRVELGANNLTQVEIVAGLDVGDRIHLVRPEGAELPDAESEERAASPAPTAVEVGVGG